ncbi:hypothetical protein SAMN04489713_13528 [Actinomadura madurae]|uniref:Uncharacterized protein n=2 Tax=Thermomonosporaceae TaxID=2012 RepID=A0A1I5YPM1_9ACTN|nr:hypothetical protein SAMN04489713_13528 [Actinomadura madurae]SPT52158.1 Uncharacterised protein [Actinomadura madurae]
MSGPDSTENRSMDIVAGGQEEPSPRVSVEPPDEDALDQVLGRDLPGYWALAAVHVKELAALGDEAAVQARCLLAGRLDEILNDHAAVYQTRSGVAVLVGPSEDLAKTRIGASLLMKATRRHLAGFGLPHAGISAPTYTVEAFGAELRELRRRVRDPEGSRVSA